MSDYKNSIVQKPDNHQLSALTHFNSQTKKDDSSSKDFQSLKDEYEKIFEKLNSSSVSLDERLNVLRQAIIALNTRLGTVAEESAYVTALQEELSNIKHSLSLLEVQKNAHTESINAFQDFVQNNLRFVMVAIKTESSFEIIEKRLSQLEGKAEKKVERSITIIGIAIAFVTSILACVVSIVLALIK